MRALWALLLLLAVPAFAQEAPARRVEARLLAETAGVVPGETVQLGLREIIEPGWHTYWINPGDAGAPTRLDWHVPPGFEAGPLIWPVPQRIPVGPFMNFGYERRVVLLTSVHVPKDAKPGTAITLSAAASWLVCKDICVPEAQRVSVTLPVLEKGPAPPDPVFAADFRMARESLPRPYAGRAAFRAEGEQLHLVLAGAPLPPAISAASFFPLSPDALRHAAPQVFAQEGDALALTLPARRAFQGASLPGVVVIETAQGRQAFAIEASAAPSAPVPAAPGWPLAFLFALVGGLILNLMPCVFPILSIKALVIARQAEQEKAALRREGLGYGAGVVLSFLAMGGVLLGLRQTGLALGWGFQFQTPVVVALMALLFLGIALNFAGLFNVAFLQNLGSSSRAKGIGGAVLTGVLAVLVASPCTAPFMATALGAALIMPPLIALSIFAGLGIGMAAPLVLLSEIPALARLLPKPGPWMARLKLILALPVAATALWLGAVLWQQIGLHGALLLTLAGTGLLLVAWWAGLWQRGRKSPLGLLSGAALSLFALLLIAETPLRHEGAPALSQRDLRSEPFSAARLAALVAAGKPVFVDVTAAWCLTCKYNEAIALSDPDVAEAFRARGVTYLLGDWTNGNPELSRLLADYGRDGVPLSLFFAPGAQRGQILPQILTPKIVVDAVNAAALPRS